MKKVTLLYICEVNFEFTKFGFEKIGFALQEKKGEFIIKDAPKEYIKTVGDVEVELFVIDRTKDEITSGYFDDIATNVTKKDIRLVELLNSAFKMATGDFVCVVPSGVVLHGNWLVELIYHYEAIAKSGVIGIIGNLTECNFAPLLPTDGEVFVSAIVPPDHLIKGVAFFDRQLLYLVGAFDESVNLIQNEINQFALRCVAMGYFNYYIPTDTCTIILHEDGIEQKEREESDSNLHGTLAEMRKVRNFYIPLDKV